jgi:hypothetical protein
MSMRRGCKRLISLAALCASFGVVYACGDDTLTPALRSDGGAMSEAGAIDSGLTDAGAEAAVPRLDAGHDATPEVVTVLVVDPDGVPVQDASVLFYEGPTPTVVPTGSDGTASHGMIDGGAVGAPNVLVMDVRNGDVVHVGPTSRGASISGVVVPPTDIDASISAAFGSCMPSSVSIEDGGFAVDIGPPLNRYQAPYGDLQVCEVGASLGATFFAADDTGIRSLAVKSASIIDGGSVIDVTSADWAPASFGTESFGGALPTGVSSVVARVDFPFASGRYSGTGRSVLPANAATDFSFLMPPAALSSQIIAYTALVRDGPVECFAGGGQVTSIRMRRMAAATKIVDTFDGMLPLLVGRSLSAPLPFDAVVYCDGTVYPLPAGSTNLGYVGPNGGMTCYEPTIIASPQLPYSLARQYPTALADPYTLLATALPTGDAELLYSFFVVFCPA